METISLIERQLLDILETEGFMKIIPICIGSKIILKRSNNVNVYIITGNHSEDSVYIKLCSVDRTGTGMIASIDSFYILPPVELLINQMHAYSYKVRIESHRCKLTNKKVYNTFLVDSYDSAFNGIICDWPSLYSSILGTYLYQYSLCENGKSFLAIKKMFTSIQR